MKNLVLLLFTVVSFNTLSAQDAWNMSLLGHWTNDTLRENTLPAKFNDIWGYAADGREYAIIGSAFYVHFLDITTPEKPVLIDQFLGGDTTIWRDMKVYKDRAYAVSDGTEEGLMIFDLSDLPNSITKTYHQTDLIKNAHDIQVDLNKGRLYAVGANSHDMIILDIATNPDEPMLLRRLNLPLGEIGGYIHDLYVKDHIAYCSHGQTSSLIVWDLEDPFDPIALASLESSGYNHSNWVTEDGQYAVYAEEVPFGLPLGVVDLRDLENGEIETIHTFKNPLLAPAHTDATPHNPFIKGDILYSSYYEDGLQVWDFSNPTNPKHIAYYDTYPSNTEYEGFFGCWGVYPFLPSGNIIVSDLQTGLYVLRLDISTVPKVVDEFSIFPNPSMNRLTICIESSTLKEVQYEMLMIDGKQVFEGQFTAEGITNQQLNISHLAAGTYILRIKTDEETISKKVIKN